MVEIRRLRPVRPVVKIALPTKPKAPNTWPSGKKVIRRTLAEFPPPTPQPTPCRLWQGSADPDGYGRMKRKVRGRWQVVRVTRWVVEAALGRSLEPHEFVLHACDHPPCFRLDHLSVGSARDNNLDMKLKGRAIAPPINRFVGSLHPMAKFNDRDIETIRRDYQTGVRVKTLAEDWNVSTRTINRIVKGLTYADTSTIDLLAEARKQHDLHVRDGQPQPLVGPDDRDDDALPADLSTQGEDHDDAGEGAR
jgi:hypothetical protein